MTKLMLFWRPTRWNKTILYSMTKTKFSKYLSRSIILTIPVRLNNDIFSMCSSQCLVWAWMAASSFHLMLIHVLPFKVWFRELCIHNSFNLTSLLSCHKSIHGTCPDHLINISVYHTLLIGYYCRWISPRLQQKLCKYTCAEQVQER